MIKHCCVFSLSLIGLLSWALPSHGQIAAPIIPGITVEIADVVQFPDTRGQGQEDSRVAANIARINFMREIPGMSDEWLVHDLRGQIYRVEPATQQVVEYLDVGDVFSRFAIGPSGLSTGLNTVAFHPDFANNGKFYSIHSETASGNPATPDFGNLSSTAGHSVLIEWTATDPTASVFSGTHREIMRVSQANRIHNLGDITFNPFATQDDPDFGMMYISGGDSNTGSPAQNLSSIYGKLLRIDPDGNNSANGEYGIPSDNPFATDGNSSTLDEIYAYGFRNLHRIGWDLQTGTFLGTDIGDGSVEEVDVLEAGKNYGWSTYEGTFLRGGGTISPSANTSNYVWPVAQYDHGDGFAIAGGFVYRGTQVPELVGKFVYGDIVNGRLFYSDFDEMMAAHNDGNYLTTADVYELFLTKNGESVTIADLVLEARNLSSLPNNRVDLRFGQTSDGELYLSTKQDGWIRQLVATPLPGDFNSDGVVNLADYTVWRDSLGAVGSDLPGDGSGNGVVDAADYDLWKLHFGETSSTAGLLATAVPEPTTVALCVGLASALFGLRWRITL